MHCLNYGCIKGPKGQNSRSVECLGDGTEQSLLGMMQVSLPYYSKHLMSACTLFDVQLAKYKWELDFKLQDANLDPKDET